MARQSNLEPKQPRAVTVQLLKDDPPFFDRHFAALLGLIGALVVAIGGVLPQMLNAEKDAFGELELSPSNPSPAQGEELVITISRTQEDMGMEIIRIDRPAAKPLEAKIANGTSFSWKAPEAGEYRLFAVKGGDCIVTLLCPRMRSQPLELSVTVAQPDPVDTNKDKGSEIIEPPDPVPTKQAQEPVLTEKIEQVFRKRISNPNSCTEGRVNREFPLCLPEGSRVVDFAARSISARNGSGTVVPFPGRSNCMLLRLTYRDSGRGVFGDCKGNGWVEYEVTLTGERELQK